MIESSSRERPRTFSPTWRRIGRLVLAFVIVLLPAAYYAESLIDLPPGLIALTAVFFGLGVIAYVVRLSPAGIHPIVEGVIPWSAIVDARRDGNVMRYQAALGEDGRTYSRTLELSPGAEDAIRRWTDARHPLRQALAAGAPQPAAVVRQPRAAAARVTEGSCSECGAEVDPSTAMYSEAGSVLCTSCVDQERLRAADAIHENERYRSGQALASAPSFAMLFVWFAGGALVRSWAPISEQRDRARRSRAACAAETAPLRPAR